MTVDRSWEHSGGGEEGSAASRKVEWPIEEVPTQEVAKACTCKTKMRLGHDKGENIKIWIYGRDFEKSQLFILLFKKILISHIFFQLSCIYEQLRSGCRSCSENVSEVSGCSKSAGE